MKIIFCLTLIAISSLGKASNDYDCPNLTGKYKSAQILNPKDYLEMIGIEINQKVINGITEYTVTRIYQGVDKNEKYTDVYAADAIDHTTGDNPVIHRGVNCFQNSFFIYTSFDNGSMQYSETKISLIGADEIAQTESYNGSTSQTFSRIK